MCCYLFLKHITASCYISTNLWHAGGKSLLVNVYIWATLGIRWIDNVIAYFSCLTPGDFTCLSCTGMCSKAGVNGKGKTSLDCGRNLNFFHPMFYITVPFLAFCYNLCYGNKLWGETEPSLWMSEEEPGVEEFSSLVLSSGLWPYSLFWQLLVNLINCKESFCGWIFISHPCLCQLNQNKVGLRWAPCTLPSTLGT